MRVHTKDSSILWSCSHAHFAHPMRESATPCAWHACHQVWVLRTFCSLYSHSYAEVTLEHIPSNQLPRFKLRLHLFQPAWLIK